MEGSSPQTLVLVLCNAPSSDAETIARTVLEARLAACVNIVPAVVSLYWWQGAITRETESTLLIKTRRELVAKLTEALVAAHPYDVPEVVALPIEHAHAPYRAWVLAETADEQSV